MHNPRKGSTIYILRKGETKALPVKVSNITKIKTSWYGNNGGYDINVELSDNEYGITGWTERHYGRGFDYSDEKYQVKEFTYTDKDSSALPSALHPVRQLLYYSFQSPNCQAKLSNK